MYCHVLALCWRHSCWSVKEYGGQSLRFSLPLREFPALYDERLTFPSPLSFLKTTDVYSIVYSPPM